MYKIQQIDRDATELKPYYQVKVSDLGTLSGVEISYTEMKKSFQEMLSISWLIEDAKNESFIAKQLLNTSSPDINCEYRNGVITLVLNPTLTPFLTNLTNYTNYQVKWYMTLSLIHISKPTRQAEISYAAFCWKKKKT